MFCTNPFKTFFERPIYHPDNLEKPNSLLAIKIQNFCINLIQRPAIIFTKGYLFLYSIYSPGVTANH